jgi:hypothetical protein
LKTLVVGLHAAAHASHSTHAAAHTAAHAHTTHSAHSTHDSSPLNLVVGECLRSFLSLLSVIKH